MLTLLITTHIRAPYILYMTNNPKQGSGGPNLNELFSYDLFYGTEPWPTWAQRNVTILETYTFNSRTEFVHSHPELFI